MAGRPFYKTWWGIVLFFLLWPFSLTYLIWKQEWNKKVKVSLIAAIWLFVFIAGLAKPQEPSGNKNVLGQTAKSSTFGDLNKTTAVVPTTNSQPNSADIPTAYIIPSDMSLPTPSISPSPSKSILYPVTRIVDGDTIDVNISGSINRIRLIGIDTPEIVDPRKPVQCFGREASKKAKELLKGKKVSLESDPTQGNKDKYDRLLRYVFLEDGTSFNKMMIAQGYAHEYTYDLPYKYQAEYKKVEVEARNNNRGLWNPNACGSFIAVTNTPHIYPTQPPSNSSNNSPYSGGFTCDCQKTCTEISSCAEAQYQLNICGCRQRDGDHDGIACDSAPLHCQN